MLEEVVALVVYKYESREVHYFSFPYSLHSQFGILNALYRLYIVLRKYCSRTTDRAEIESAVAFSRVGYHLGTVAFCYHYHRTSVLLEQIDVRIHAVCRCRAH